MADDLLDALRVHRANLGKLEVQRAQHGLQVPLDILNSIEAERQAIQEIEQELENRRQQVVRMPPLAETGAMADFTSYPNNVVVRLDDLVKEVHRLATAVAVNEQRMVQLQSDFSELRGDVRALHAAPEPIFSRATLVIGAIGIIAILALMLALSYRILQL